MINSLNMDFDSSTTGPIPNFQFASFPGGPGIPAGVSIQMGSIPGMPLPGMFGPGQIGNLIGNLMGLLSIFIIIMATCSSIFITPKCSLLIPFSICQ